MSYPALRRPRPCGPARARAIFHDAALGFSTGLLLPRLATVGRYRYRSKWREPGWQPWLSHSSFRDVYRARPGLGKRQPCAGGLIAVRLFIVAHHAAGGKPVGSIGVRLMFVALLSSGGRR